MSHFQHNINVPQFPPGAHMSHFSLTNTTLIGQEVQQRLWEKYWGQQYPVPPSPYLWPHPGIYYYGYPYGLPGVFPPASQQGGFEQLQRPVLWQIGERSDNYATGRIGEQCLESHREQNVLVEVLEEGNGWSTNRGQGADKHKKDAHPVRHKIVDPVTDDLNWNMFSGDLADGIVVSILDSFVLDLPVLDSSTVQSVFESLEKSAFQTEDQLQSTPRAEKEEYFKDILSLTKPRVEQSRDLNSESKEITGKLHRIVSPKGKHHNEGKRVVPSSETGIPTDRALEHCKALTSPSMHDKQDSLQASDYVPESKNRPSEKSSLTERSKAGKSIDYASKDDDSPTSSNHKENGVRPAPTERKGRSSGLNTRGKIFHVDSEYYSAESAKSTDNTNSDPKEECHSPKNVTDWDKPQITSQEECHSLKSGTAWNKSHETSQGECHSSTHVTSEIESIADEYGNLVKCLLTDEHKEQANNLEDPTTKNTSSD